MTTDRPIGEQGMRVGDVARLVEVTARMLRHWDEIGLASPSGRSAAGYRLYTREDVDRVHRVVAYREIGLGLEEIREVLDGPGLDISVRLREQRSLLADRIRRLRELDERLERMTAAHEQGLLLSDAEQRETFGEEWDPAHAVDARSLWGHTPQWAQFAERSASRTRAEWEQISESMRALQQDLASALERGVAPGSAEANDLVEAHRELFSQFFPLSREMQVCLGRMYETDPGFASYHDGIRSGLAAWLRRAIDASARAHDIDPETATWQ